MARGPKRHLKRVNAPSHWMLGKLNGVWAPRPSTGPHKLRECLPLCVLLRNRLRYALTGKEVTLILMQRLVKVDGKVRTDTRFPTGFQDVVTIDSTKENFRMLFDTKGRFVTHKVGKEEAAYKLCKVKKVITGNKGVPYITTHDARTIRYPEPDIKVNDTVRVDVATGKILDFAKFENGQVAMIQGGNNMGRVGLIAHREKHPGSFDMVHLVDSTGKKFCTRMQNVFVIGQGEKAWISLPKNNGIKMTNIEDRANRMSK